MSSQTLRHLAKILSILLALAVVQPAAAREWLRAESPGFVVYSDGYAHELRRWVRKAEMFDQLLREQFDKQDGKRGARLTIYLLEDERSVARLTGQRYLTGSYTPSSEGSFAIAHRKPGYSKTTLSGQATLFHEYTHHFMYRHFPAAYPAWYREGLAELAATATFDIEGYWTFGKLAGYRARYLSGEPLPIESLLFSGAEALEPKRRAEFYAWSRLLVHMLGVDTQRSEQMQAYLKAFGSGTKPRVAARAFGDLDKLERDLATYATTSLRHTRSKEPIVYEGEIEVTALDPVESQLAELRLMRLGRHLLEPAREQLDALADTSENPDVLVELALTERDLAKSRRSRDMSAAEAAVNRALAVDPGHGRANVLKAELSMPRLRRGEGADRAGWIAVRRMLHKAIASDPEDALPHYVLFRSYIDQAGQPNLSAHAAMQKAFALQPESSEIRIGWAVSLALRGRFDEAAELARVLAYDPHAARIGQRALVTIERMRKAAGRTRNGRVKPAPHAIP